MSPTSEHKEMGPKEWFEFMKMLEEYQKSQKPKDDKAKMVPAPPDWGPLDYFLLYATIHTAGALVLATFLIYYITHIVH